MHDLSPLLRTVLTATGVFSSFVAVAFGWAAFILDGAGKIDVAGVYLLMSGTVAVASGWLLRTVWGK